MEHKTRSRSISLLHAILLLVPSISYAILGDAPFFPVVVFLLLLVVVVSTNSLTVTKRSIIYSVTISFLFAVIFNLLYPVDEDRFFIPLPIEVIIPLLIAFGICCSFFSQTSRTFLLISSTSVFAMMLSGTGVTNPQNPHLFLPPGQWNNRFWVIAVLLAIQLCALLPLLHIMKGNRKGNVKTLFKEKKRPAVVYAIALLFFAGMTFGLCHAVVVIESSVEPILLNYLISYYLDSPRRKIVFPANVSLYRKLSPHIKAQQDRIILRAFSATPPGYLRGRTYTDYQQGKWKSAEENTPLATKGNPPKNIVSRVFVISDELEDEQSASMEIIPSRYFYSDVLLVPGNVKRVELIAERLERDRNGTLFPHSWDKNGAYTIEMGKRFRVAYNQPRISPTISPPQYLDVAANIQSELKEISATIFGQASSNKDKVRHLESYFSSNFSYDLQFSSPETTDPVLHFLQQEKSGHCELFASATALLLRTAGIPTRYVTGFVCGEPHLFQPYWIARLGDCHAWVEAWIAEEKRWVIIETTPPTGIPGLREKSSFIASCIDLFITAWKLGYSKVKRGYFSDVIFAALENMASTLVWLFWQYEYYYLCWTILLLFTIFLIRFRKRRSSRQHLFIEQVPQELDRIYQIIEAHLKKQGIIRTRYMTIRDIITQLNKQQPSPHPSELIPLLIQYEIIRYHPQNREISVLTSLTRKLTDLEKS